MSKARAAELQYKRAFDEFARVVGRVQALVAQPDSDRHAVEIARVDLESARIAYIQARDTWAEFLLPSTESDPEDQRHKCKAQAVA